MKHTKNSFDFIRQPQEFINHVKMHTPHIIQFRTPELTIINLSKTYKAKLHKQAAAKTHCSRLKNKIMKECVDVEVKMER